MILQAETGECGLACLAIICTLHGNSNALGELRRKFSVSLRGANFAQLIRHADSIGFAARPLRLELEQLSMLQMPCILHWDLNHFVVLTKVGASGMTTIMDPAVGNRRLTLSEVSRHFSGVALELTPGANFKVDGSVGKLPFVSLMGKVSGLKRSLVQIFSLAVVLELFAATSPLLNQLVVDEAIATHDVDLLSVVLVGFALLLLIQTMLGVARSWLVMVLGQSWALQWASNVFRHLIRLPVDFYEKRHLGDIVSRFGSVEMIQRTLTLSLIEAIIDGAMGLVALALMFTYSPMLTLVVLGAVSAYGVLRVLVYRPVRDAAAERLVVSAREKTHFLETLRAIVPLKLFGREQQRSARWQNLIVEVQNRDVRSYKMTIAFNAAHTFVLGLENLLVFWLGAGLVMQTSVVGHAVFTIGMLFAFVSYKSQFSGRVIALIDHAVEIKMLGLHAERLADIALAAPEQDDVPPNSLAHLEPSIELIGVSFRYSAGEPWVLNNVDLRLSPGECVAIVGPSGCGKTTLLKVVLGLLEPTNGEVLYGGVPVRQLGLRNYRGLVGTVMQEDLLLGGSIADNISFFDDAHDEERVHECARLSVIHDDVCKMPMGYQTLVGDMGSSLSGGQRQRVLLARALYKRPKVLALDEATSHLDLVNEKLVAQALVRMELTRIVVAHRPETIAGAQRVVRLHEGRINDLRAVEAPTKDAGSPSMTNG